MVSNLLITFKNAHDVVSGERKLIDAGIEVKMMNAPKTLGPGCDICLAINPADIKKVRLLLGGNIREINLDDPGPATFSGFNCQ